MATVSLDHVTKRFGEIEAVRDVSIDIADGEFIVIVGPSGCGKSTLLRMVAGLETVTEGEVRIGEKRVNEVEPMDRDIAMVFQNYALYPHMSVFDNMAYGLKIARRPRAEIEERVRAAAHMLQLEPYLERRPRALSGGQRQRVAMGRAIVRRPSVFLFDEPLSNLDAKLRVQMRLEIKQLQRELGVTALYVTHDQVEAMTLADRMLVMHDGVADQIGAPLDVYAEPRTEFVAGFIGSPPTNFIDAPSAGGGPGGRVGVRPEHVRFTAAGDGRIDATVQSVEPLGAETLVHVRTAANGFATVRQEGALAIPDEGAAVALDWSERDEMRFEEDGRRMDSNGAH